MEFLIMGLTLVGAMWAGAKRPEARPVLFTVQTEGRCDLWEG